jgi:xylulokinase
MTLAALLSVDLGTTGVKAAAYTTDGRLLGASYLEYPLIRTGDGIVEQDAELWWTLSKRVMQEAVAQANILPESVQALGVSTQGISFVPVDRAGRVLRNAINWLDTRATQEACDIRTALGEGGLFQITGKLPSAAYVLPKLLWLRRHERTLYDRTAKFLMAHDFLISRLCGTAITDYSMAGGSALLDVKALTWSAELLTTFDIGPQRLPQLAWSGTVAGQLRDSVAIELGLQGGTPVVVGGQDQKCAALGAGIRPGLTTVSLGTASAITSLSKTPALDPRRRLPLFPFVSEGLWAFEGVVSTAGAALRWLRDALFPGAAYEQLDTLAANAPAGANGVRFFPHLAGATSPLWREDAHGAFLGIDLATDPGDIVRSVLEGVAFQIRANVDVMAQLTKVDTLILFGGGAHSRLWARIIAAASGRPVQVTRTVDVANWGACVLAGVGVDLIDLRAIDDAIGAPRPEISPRREDIERYQAVYEHYLLLQQRMIDEDQ